MIVLSIVTLAVWCGQTENENEDENEDDIDIDIEWLDISSSDGV